jgi:methylenetetrahydrofolate dehydrogenase (NADP+)/methenyltetrahydrofolate cyclohydrolase
MGEILYGDHIAESVMKTLELPLNPRGLGIIIHTENHAGEIYVKKKIQACERLGFQSTLVKLNDANRIYQTIEWFNEDPNINGILLQLPLHRFTHTDKYFNEMDPLKDVEGFHAINTGLFDQGFPRYIPCTPLAVLNILLGNKIEVSGKKVTVINRSCVVGKPLFTLLTQYDATVCMCHDKTTPETLKESCLWADIIVVAVGIRKFLTADMVHSESVVVDVGTNRDENGKLCGDVDFIPVLSKAKAVTAVPRGVGPLTVSMLMQNLANQKSVFP